MKRITFVAIFALFAAVTSTGCFAQAGSGDGGEEEQVSGRARVYAPGDDDRNPELIAAPAHALELKSHSTDDGQGPHPEPWLDRQGPHPEPWTGRIAEPDPNAGGTPSKP
jgi:hypothetical protein